MTDRLRDTRRAHENDWLVRHATRLRVNDEVAVRDCLGRWVSELEPVVCRAGYHWPDGTPPHSVLGLTAEGHSKVYVRALHR